MTLQTTLTFVEDSPDAASAIRVSRTDTPNEPLGDLQVLVQFLASPINPQDLLVIAGRYPVKPSHKHNGLAIPGYDGVCRVIATGRNVTELKPGDHAVPSRHGLGTWRSHAVVDSSALIKIPSDLDPVAASLLKMGAVVAWLLLEQREGLRPGDWLVQNAASGVIAQFVSQLARLRGLHTLSIIRDREDADHLRQRLVNLGADAVMTEAELEACRGQVPCLKGKRVVLALDSVFGESGNRLVSVLTHGGSYINYGSLGGADGELRLSQQDLFWKRINFANFRLSASLAAYDQDQFSDLLGWLCQCFLQGQLRVPDVELVSLSKSDELESLVRETIAKATAQGLVGNKKKVFVFE
ncbi:hypothetical protein HIM_03004 [Hirsutella minnesotensis 3608]|nr:hypothetical protein HIM_03004 [Hirsutella minnesotensis 3608]